MNAVRLFYVLVICWHSRAVRAQQRSPVCYNVQHGRFVRGSESCQAYNYCANGAAYPGVCPPRHSFNAQTELCDHEDRVNCEQCSAQGLQNIADPRDCRKFYRCVGGIRTQRQCPTGLMFDTRLGDCNFDTFSMCQVVVSVCAQFSHLGPVFVGNANDCTRYFLCYNGVEQSMFCGPNTFYNPHFGRCEYFVSSCQGNGPLIPISQTPQTTLPVWVQPPTTTPFPSASEPPRCHMYISMGLVFISNPNDCTSFYTCHNGILATYICGGNLYYNPVTTQCQRTCESSPQAILQTPPPIATTTAKPQLPVGDARCIAMTGYNGIAGSCTKYVYCMSGIVTFETECTGATYYHVTGPCVLTAPPGCGPAVVPPIGQDSRCLQPTGSFALTGSCTKFVVCLTGKVNYESECIDNYYFHKDQQHCLASIPPECDTGSQPTPNPLHDPRCLQPTGSFALAGSCTKFAVCSSGIVNYESQCIANYYFHKDQQRCLASIPPECVAGNEPAADPLDDPRCLQPTGSFALAGSCTKYAVCLTGKVNYENECIDNYYFHKDQQRCLASIPPECVAVNEPEPVPIPNPEPVPEPIPDPPPAPEPVNLCVRAAGYFTVPGTGCQTYVYCIRSEVRFTYTCEAGTWYNEMYSRCVNERPEGC